jgi:hypothetical protein
VNVIFLINYSYSPLLMDDVAKIIGILFTNPSIESIAGTLKDGQSSRDF